MSHADVAMRFMDMCDTLDAIKATYVRVVPRNQSGAKYPRSKVGEPYLVTHLRHWVEGYVAGRRLTRTEREHRVMRKVGRDGRRQLPNTVSRAGWDKEGVKFEVKWIVCYLEGILPYTDQPNWQQMECSHRCINSGLDHEECIDHRCLCRESKSANQSRGNTFCCKPCAHSCGEVVCECQHFHDPSCI